MIEQSKVCLQCGVPTNRENGYCSVYCEDMAEKDRRIAALQADLADEKAGRPLLSAATDKINDLQNQLAMGQAFVDSLVTGHSREMTKLRAELAALKEAFKVLRRDDAQICTENVALKIELNALKEASAATCLWTEDSDGNWDTACGHSCVFDDGGPEWNECYFCQGCGKKLVAKKYEPEEEEE